MSIQGIQIMAGIASTILFACCKIPMLVKVIRTRDLHSYSLLHLTLSSFGNMTYWIYVVSLPFGPVYILQAFYTVADLTMLSLYLYFSRSKNEFLVKPKRRKIHKAKAEFPVVSQD